jgi:hypothetical protein
MHHARIGMLTSIICLILAISLYSLSTPLLHWAGTITKRAPASPLDTVATKQLHTSLYSTSTMSRTPVYFLSHGGPNIMEDYDHPAYAKLQEIGKEITQKVKPKAVVVFSAHWQAGRNSIEVNVAENTSLIYDFGGHVYSVLMHHLPLKQHANCVLAGSQNTTTKSSTQTSAAKKSLPRYWMH